MYTLYTPVNFSVTSDPAAAAFLALTELQGKPFLFYRSVV